MNHGLHMETAKAVVAILLILVALPVLILWLNDRISGRSPSKKKLEEYSRLFKERLIDPDFLAAEKHFGCALPVAIRDLYGDKNELLRGDFELENPRKGGDEPDTWYVAFYSPLDNQAIGAELQLNSKCASSPLTTERSELVSQSATS